MILTAKEKTNITKNSVHTPKTDNTHQMKRVKTLILIIAILLPFSIISQRDILQNKDDDQKEELSDDTHWLDNYEPKYGLGPIQYNWWITYYHGHPESGSHVNHTDWVIKSLKNNSVVVLIHGTTCHGCEETKKNMQNCLEIYGSNFTYFDLNADGEDNKTDEAFNAYDPNGGKNSIPLTVIITLVTDENNETRIAWHSAEGERSKEWIESYMQDSIYYYRNNRGVWRNLSHER